MDRKQIHKKVLEAQTTEELMDAYDLWAAQYDSDLLTEMGYIAPSLTTAILKKHVADHDARILDVGCGTGVVGSLLAESGFTSVDGLDYSEAMLAKAKLKKVYRRLFQADLTTSLVIEDNSYDGLISVGTFTLGHVGPDAFAELIKITRPGGIICCTVRQEAWKEHDYRRRTIELEMAGQWELKEMQTVDYIREEGSICVVLVYNVV